ncbi:hypothetical protein BC940DRAFT_154185 [Gongronella butleri]|nr:hypothetical protein BC940DRAFT_154185 [Gongronella butleri]
MANRFFQRSLIAKPGQKKNKLSNTDFYWNLDSGAKQGVSFRFLLVELHPATSGVFAVLLDVFVHRRLTDFQACSQFSFSWCRIAFCQTSPSMMASFTCRQIGRLPRLLGSKIIIGSSTTGAFTVGASIEALPTGSPMPGVVLNVCIRKLMLCGVSSNCACISMKSKLFRSRW